MFIQDTECDILSNKIIFFSLVYWLKLNYFYKYIFEPFYRIVSALEINLKSENNQSDTEDQQFSISKIMTTSISVTNANIFLIADKKSMFLFY